MRKFTGTARRPEIDALLTGAYSAEEIGGMTPPLIRKKQGDQARVTRERIRQYIRDTGQRQTFMEKRKMHTKGRLRRRLVAALKTHAIQRAYKESRAMQKFVDYYLNARRPLGIPIQKFGKFLRLYKDAEDSGTKPSMEELAAQSGIGLVSYRVLKIFGLETPYGRVRRFHRIPPEKKQAIERAYYTDMPLSDIAFFLGLAQFNVQHNMQRIFGDTGTRKQYIEQFTVSDSGGYFSYRHASQIYEAQGLGFNEGEIAYLFDIKPRAVQYAMQHRQKIGQGIITALDVLYPDVKHEKPYLNSAPVMRVLSK